MPAYLASQMGWAGNHTRTSSQTGFEAYMGASDYIATHSITPSCGFHANHGRTFTHRKSIGELVQNVPNTTSSCQNLVSCRVYCHSLCPRGHKHINTGDYVVFLWLRWMRWTKKDLIITYFSTKEQRTFWSRKGGFCRNITRERRYLLGNYEKNHF